MTLIRVTTETHSVVLESARDPLECCDYVRQKLCGDLPAKDERFEAAMKMQREALRAERFEK